MFVIGAVLTFALNLQVDWVDLDLVGYLLMGAGLLVFIIGLVLMLRKRQTVTSVHQRVDPASGASVSERRTSTTPDDVA